MAEKKGDKANRRADRHTSPRVAFHLPARLLAELDAWRDGHPVPPGRSDVLRVALERFLAEQTQNSIP